MSARHGGGVCSAAGGVARHSTAWSAVTRTAHSSDMDDLDGLFSAASPATVPAPAPGFPAPPVAQFQFPGQQQVPAPAPAPGFGLPPAMAQQLPGQQPEPGTIVTSCPMSFVAGFSCNGRA